LKHILKSYITWHTCKLLTLLNRHSGLHQEHWKVSFNQRATVYDARSQRHHWCQAQTKSQYSAKTAAGISTSSTTAANQGWANGIFGWGLYSSFVIMICLYSKLIINNILHQICVFFFNFSLNFSETLFLWNTLIFTLVLLCLISANAGKWCW